MRRSAGDEDSRQIGLSSPIADDVDIGAMNGMSKIHFNHLFRRLKY
jgi:hypothetical protein